MAIDCAESIGRGLKALSREDINTLRRLVLQCGQLGLFLMIEKEINFRDGL